MTTTENRILVVVPDVEAGSHVMQAAVEHAEREAASLVVLHCMPTRVYERRQQNFSAANDFASDGLTYTRNQALEHAESISAQVAQTALGDRDVPYTTVGRIGDPVSTMLAVAAANDCETILLPETVSWWGFRVGGVDRRVAKRFDGTVVRVPRPVPENLRTTRPLPAE